MMNWPMPKPIRNVDSTACGRLAIVMWNAEAMFGSAGSIMSIASGFSAMIDAITTTNSGKPIGRWLDETQAVGIDISHTAYLIGNAALSDYVALQQPMFRDGCCAARGRRSFEIPEEPDPRLARIAQ